MSTTTETITTKVCRDPCGRELPLGDYSPDKRKRDGRQARCKPCCAAERRGKPRQSSEATRILWRAATRRYRQTDKGRTTARRGRRLYLQTEKGRTIVYAVNRRSRERNAEKLSATRKRQWSEAGKPLMLAILAHYSRLPTEAERAAYAIRIHLYDDCSPVPDPDHRLKDVIGNPTLDNVIGAHDDAIALAWDEAVKARAAEALLCA